MKCRDKDWMGGPCSTTDDEYITALTAERDAAIRERDNFRQIAQTFESLCLREQERKKVFKARVADLESQLESVACRAATAETALESRNVTPGEGLRAAQAASGGNRPETPDGSTQTASGGGEGKNPSCPPTDRP